jgi:serine/threonine protein kinase
LPESFAGAGSDLVLLGHPAAQGDAIEWRKQMRQVPRFPPVVFLGTGDERQIVAAIKAGAEDYVARPTLSHARLIEALEDALASAGSQADSGSHRRPRIAAGRDELPGLPGYEILSRLSEGHVSSVYLARVRSSGHLVVLKVLRQVPDAGIEQHFDRFLQEYEIVARIKHPNVVRIFDLGVADDHAYIAMEYCGRGSLKRRIAEGIDSEQAFAWMRVIAGALGALHAVGICHRDLKPTNIMFRDDDSLVLIDFGLARQAHFRSAITGTGAIFGTPYYMSPEQGQGSTVDRRSDLYSLGVIFFEMLTGAKPFQGEHAMSVIIQHREAPVPRLPAGLSRFQSGLDRMLAKNPADRFQSADDVLAWAPAGGTVASLSAERQ